MHFVGVDGCRVGWVAVGLTEAGEPSHDRCTGRRPSRPVFAITPRILDVEEYLRRSDAIVAEVTAAHPRSAVQGTT